MHRSSFGQFATLLCRAVRHFQGDDGYGAEAADRPETRRQQDVTSRHREVMPVKHHKMPPVEDPSCLDHHGSDLLGIVFDFRARVAVTEH